MVSVKVFGFASSGGSTFKNLGFDFEASKKLTESKKVTELTGDQKYIQLGRMG